MMRPPVDVAGQAQAWPIKNRTGRRRPFRPHHQGSEGRDHSSAQSRATPSSRWSIAASRPWRQIQDRCHARPRAGTSSRRERAWARAQLGSGLGPESTNSAPARPSYGDHYRLRFGKLSIYTSALIRARARTPAGLARQHLRVRRVSGGRLGMRGGPQLLRLRRWHMMPVLAYEVEFEPVLTEGAHRDGRRMSAFGAGNRDAAALHDCSVGATVRGQERANAVRIL